MSNPIKIDENNIPENRLNNKKTTCFPKSWTKDSITKEWIDTIKNL